jgi:hypothetical protein
MNVKNWIGFGAVLIFGLAFLERSVFTPAKAPPFQEVFAQSKTPDPCTLPPPASSSSKPEVGWLSAGKTFHSSIGVDITAPQNLKNPVQIAVSDATVEEMFATKKLQESSATNDSNARVYKISYVPPFNQSGGSIYTSENDRLIVSFPIAPDCILYGERIIDTLPKDPSSFKPQIKGVDPNLAQSNKLVFRGVTTGYPSSLPGGMIYPLHFFTGEKERTSWKMQGISDSGIFYTFSKQINPPVIKSLTGEISTKAPKWKFENIDLEAPKGSLRDTLHFELTLLDSKYRYFPEGSDIPLSPIYSLYNRDEKSVPTKYVRGHDLFLSLDLPKSIPSKDLGLQYFACFSWANQCDWRYAQTFVDELNKKIIIRLSEYAFKNIFSFMLVERIRNWNRSSWSDTDPLQWKGKETNKVVRSEKLMIYLDKKQTTLDGLQLWLDPYDSGDKNKASVQIDELDPSSIIYPIYNKITRHGKIYRIFFDESSGIENIHWRMPTPNDVIAKCFTTYHLYSLKLDDRFYYPVPTYQWDYNHIEPDDRDKKFIDGKTEFYDPDMGYSFFMGRGLGQSSDEMSDRACFKAFKNVPH